jgi:hypothetical protein
MAQVFRKRLHASKLERAAQRNLMSRLELTMQKICFLPRLDNGLNALPSVSAAGIAAPFDEVVVNYPKLTYYLGDYRAADIVKRTNALLPLLDRQVWIQLDLQWPEFDVKMPKDAYALALEATTSEVCLFWQALPVEMRRLVKGFTFDHADYNRQFGAAQQFPNTNGVVTRFNRYYANSLVALCREYALPAMLISGRVADLAGDVYRFNDADIPGGAKWPSILGQDSSLNDWLIARDVFYAPLASQGDSGYTEIVDNGSSYLGLRNVFWQFFEALPVLRRAQSGNCSVGILQHMDFTGEASDGALGPALTADQRGFLTGLSTILRLADLDGYGVAALPNQRFIPSLAQITRRVILPETRTGKTVFYTKNGALCANYPCGGSPVTLVMDQQFSTFTIKQLGQTA